jgi:signal transduction histidine kinase
VINDARARLARRRPARGRQRRPGIRTRVLAIALIPSAALFVTSASVAGYLVSEGLSARAFANYFAQAGGGIVQATSAVQQERTLSLMAVGGDRQALASLPAQWDATNAAITKIQEVGQAGQGLDPRSVSAAQEAAASSKFTSQLGPIRKNVEAGRASVSEIDAFYSSLVALASATQLQVALSAPGVAPATDGITALTLFSAPELHSRAFGLGAGWAERGVLSRSDRLEMAQLTGAYQNDLQALIPQLPPAEQAFYKHITSQDAWQLATSGQAELALNGKLAVPFSSWVAAEKTVSADLQELWGDELRYAQSAAVTVANQTLSRSILLGSLALVAAVGGFTAALVLANGLVRRLQRLRRKTLELADVTLPSLVQRISDGEQVDAGAEVGLVGYGSDEIGQVAEAFNTAQQTAAAAAAAEARARTGLSKVFLDIAHRSQLVVQRQLEILDAAEARQSDPEDLELLFQLDHLTTRARRNAENLVVLGGAQPGRRWRRPAALEDVVRSAVSETEHFARVSAVRLPDVRVQGAAVGDLIHLLAELVDNATFFSPPDAPVTVHGNRVGKGVVVEVEDQGLGIEYAERELLNETLRTPPGFQAMAFSGQRHLGLFVVGQLAKRHGIGVSLVESAYGGIKAIVLIPANVVEADGAANGATPATHGPGRHEQPRSAPDRDASDQLTRPRGAHQVPPSGQRPIGPLAEAIPQPPARPQVQAPATSVPWDPLPGPGDSTARPTTRSRAPLPRRERMANLAPGLRPDADTPKGSAARRMRSSEAARGSMSALQRGTRLGRDVRDERNQ